MTVYPELCEGQIKQQGEIWVGSDLVEDYWGELEIDTFRELLEGIRENSNFDLTVLDYFRGHKRNDLYCYICDLYGRNAWQEFLNKIEKGIAVDLGAGLGAITEGLSNQYKRIYSIEGCAERCKFLSARKASKKLDNVIIIQNGIYSLPFHDKSVDLVACNGVLEWAGVGKEGKVEAIQLDVLKEICRILKDDGIIYIGIENRFGHQYIRGGLDHSGKRYTSLVPRWLANIVCRNVSNEMFSYTSKNGAYRTYTYTASGYRSMLMKAGFSDVRICCVEPSYDIPRYAVPLNASSEGVNSFMKLLLNKKFNLWDPYICSNFFIFASKNDLNGRIRDKPIYFGYFDRIQLNGNKVIRKNRLDKINIEKAIHGSMVLGGCKTTINTQDIIGAYEDFISGRTIIQPTPVTNHIAMLIDDIGKRYLSSDLTMKLKREILSKHCEKDYHGDFWLGNIIEDQKKQRYSLIDPESNIFGSRKLDAAEFILDFKLNKRGQQFNKISITVICDYFDIDLRDTDLIAAAIFHQFIRYLPTHRCHPLVYTYLELLEKIDQGIASIEIFGQSGHS